MKTLSALTTLCFFFTFLHAQKVTFSEPEKTPYTATGNFIIGKIKNNILVCKYITPSKKFEILVYDYNMKLKARIPFNTFANGDLYKLDFISHDNYFDAVAQYYSKKIFYCKAARFNEEAILMQQPVTLDSVRVTADGNNEVYSLVQSENKKEICLLQALQGVKKDCLQLNYFMLDNNLAATGRKKICIPFNPSFTSIGSINMDNEGSLVFAEYIHKGFIGSSNTLGIFKIEKNSELLLNTQHEMGENEITDISINIDNNHARYFISGIFEGITNEDNNSASTGIFTSVLNTNLSEKAADSFYYMHKLPGLETAGSDGSESFALSNVNAMNDSGYTMLYSVDRAPRIDESYSAPVPRSILNTDQNPFYKPINNSFNQVPVSSLGVPASPVYYNTQNNAYTSTDSYGTYLPPYNKPSIKAQAGNRKLFLMHVNNSNQIEWSLNLNSNLEQDVISFVNLYQCINTGNELHFLFPQMIDEKSGRMGAITVDARGAVNTVPVISNDFNYHFQTAMGVQIDPHSLVFPCEAHGKLAFARIEF